MINIVKRLFSKMQSSALPIQISKDHYRAIHLHLNSKIDQKTLKESIIENTKQKISSIWVHLKQQNLSHVNMLCNQLGFQIHHGLKKEISLYRWMSELQDLVTPYSMFYISCGAIVIKDNHILLIQQKNGPRKGCFGIPGGRADFGQTLMSCAQRQLFQQAGLKGKYKNILYFRQLDQTVFNGSDIYFACLLTSQDIDRKNVKICNREINSFEWVHLDKYEQFMKTRSFGTQKYLSIYLNKLYRQGFNFQTDQPNITKLNVYDSKVDSIKRTMIEHMLVQQKKKPPKQCL